jgi:hypothetical protein
MFPDSRGAAEIRGRRAVHVVDDGEKTIGFSRRLMRILPRTVRI